MKQPTRLISAGAICQLCRQARAEVLFRNRVWCVLDAIAEVQALRGSIQARAGRKAS